MSSAKGQTEDENFSSTTGPAEQVSSATHERKKMISMSNFFAGGGEMMEWKTALTAPLIPFHFCEEFGPRRILCKNYWMNTKLNV